MNVGFTGSRKGMTDKQKATLKAILSSYAVWEQPLIFHHGDCVGADNEAHIIATRLNYTRIVHPPVNDKLRAFCKGDVILAERDYITRNHDIVKACDILLACPRGPEVLHSGTWATIRYARNSGKTVVVINPFDGKEEKL